MYINPKTNTGMSYSQNEEERYILEACSGIEAGRFLDIGAWDARKFSNTRALFERGWRGVMIEPSPGPLKNLVLEYGSTEGMTVIGAAVGVEEKVAPIQITDDALSSGEAAHIDRWASYAKYLGALWVPHLTPDWIMHQFGAFNFVSIDTEGTSLNILDAILKTEMLPRCICVEHDNRIVEVSQIAQSRCYACVYTSGENMVWVMQ